MRTICLYFQIHQPFRFKRYRFFEIGNEHYYYDDYLNESILSKVSEKCYLPANKIMLDLIEKYKGKFKLTFSISGIALDQFELYAPEVLESFKELARTGQVEFLAETYAHSLVALKSSEEFAKQVNQHKAKIKELFGVEPKVFRNTELVYSDDIGNMVADIGFNGMLTEGAKHVLGWRSPNFLYNNAINPKLKVLLKNFVLSDDIAFRFSNKSWSQYPLTADKYARWLNDINKKEEIVNLFMDYETFGEHQWADTGIFEFLKALPGTVFKNTKFTFSTPSEIIENFQPVGAVNVPYPISWADEERDLTAWLGNPLQEQAFNKLYDLLEKVKNIDDEKLQKDFNYLQVSDHFYYMATKFFSDGEVHSYFNPYSNPYEAFINYMNVLTDFEIRVNAASKAEDGDEAIRLSKIIEEKNELIKKYEDMMLKKPGDRVKSTTRKKTATEKTTAKAGSDALDKKTSKAKKPVAKKPATSKTAGTAKKSVKTRK
jgi:alpha-amylase